MWRSCWRQCKLRPNWPSFLLLLISSLLLVLLYYQTPHRSSRSRGVAIVHGDGSLAEYLNHVIRVLSVVGYEVRLGYNAAASSSQPDDDWNVLWSHTYPFVDKPELQNLGAHQKVNKIPGMGHITNKVGRVRCFLIPGPKLSFQNYPVSHS